MIKLLTKFLYGVFFVVILPVFLWYWAGMLDASTGMTSGGHSHGLLSLAVAFAGLIVMTVGMFQIVVQGKGLPMNISPPKRYVTGGVYRVFSHPIYAGAVMVGFGVFGYAASPAGVYLVAPIFALMTLSLIYGYEDLAIGRLFGKVADTSEHSFSLPKGPITFGKKLLMLVRVFAPWTFLMVLWGFDDDVYFPFNVIDAFLHALPFVVTLVVIMTSNSRERLVASTHAGTAGFVAYGVLMFVLRPIQDRTLYLSLVAVMVTALVVFGGRIWAAVRGISERVANARRDFIFFNGNFRVISHAKYPILAGIVAEIVFYYVTRNSVATLVIVFCALVGAAVFAQVLWGSKKLLRPFGYYGGVVGGIVGIVLSGYVLNMDFALIAVGAVIAGAFAQAICRFRCLEQGCCHGVEVDSAALGIRVTNPQSRVVLNSGLAGRYLLPTQTYSILFNFALGGFLLYLWQFELLPGTVIVGLYLILTGIERFTEDAYRGEVQTRKFYALNEPQLFALICLALGVIITLLPAQDVARSEFVMDWTVIIWALLSGAFAGFMMSMDFPKSYVRFSRLSG